MADDGATATEGATVTGSHGDAPEDALTEFVYAEHRRILDRHREQSQRLKDQAATLLRLLGAILTLYTGAAFLAARLSWQETTQSFHLFFNQFTLTSAVLLALSFVLASVAHHSTAVKSGPSPAALQALPDGMTAEQAKRAINEQVPAWVADNESALDRGRTQLFYCKLAILFSLGYLAVGASYATTVGETSLLVNAASYLVVTGVAVGLVFGIRWYAGLEPTEVEGTERGH